MATTKAVYYDTKNNKIVEGKQPEECIVIVAEGEDITDETRALRMAQYESLQAARADDDAATPTPVETADAPPAKRTATVTTKSTGKPSPR